MEIRDLFVNSSIFFHRQIARHEDHLEGHSASSYVPGVLGHRVESNPATTTNTNSSWISDKQNQKYGAAKINLRDPVMADVY